ncbi:MAG: hypothetical protein BWY04_01268 [candidate division CPR1 bacterium ADurb.Bin160]|uniref:Uncharacterized protein n=1 Tax=candidate division CPR1 bacterium ADurb.Bin160 TaxID=1852826 RepID=A0A1V5ZKE1_9BACT|nr:MAG: hypothetical protein BWY04_01268 [candidate division CPR1 bacterium ADurb.Bin160]
MDGSPLPPLLPDKSGLHFVRRGLGGEKSHYNRAAPFEKGRQLVVDGSPLPPLLPDKSGLHFVRRGLCGEKSHYYNRAAPFEKGRQLVVDGSPLPPLLRGARFGEFEMMFW